MITEYELHSDERLKDPSAGNRYMTLGGVICTSNGHDRLRNALCDVRKVHALNGEVKWGKVSNRYFEAYKGWLNVFFDDPHARYSALCVNQSSKEWQEFRRANEGDRGLASVYYQFLINTFGRIHDTQRWHVHPDAGYFSVDKVLDNVEFLFNRTYKKAFGQKSTRVIRFAQSHISHKSDLIQLADLLLGCVACTEYGITPPSLPRRSLLGLFQDRKTRNPTTQRELRKICVYQWVTPENFQYPQTNSGRGT